MSGITDPAQEYFKDGLWGWVTDQWKKLVATAGGALHVQVAGQEADVDVKIAAQTVDVEIKQTAPADLTPGVCGWDGSSWRKLPMLWGYSDRYLEAESNLNASAGTNFLSSTAVPAGKIRVVTGIDAVNVNTNPSVILFAVLYSATRYNFRAFSSPGAGVHVATICNVVLKEGDLLSIGFGGCAAGDDIYAWAVGYEMKVAE